jgi:hypothetical protein
MKIKSNLLFTITLLIGLCLTTNLSFAAYYKNVWPKWAVHSPLSTEVISHQEWQEFLKQCVITNQEGINLVDYPHLTETELDTLQNYINRLSQLDISKYNRNEQLAYWINLYNALTVQIVADYYPVDSIQEVNISPGLFTVGPWGANLLTIGHTQLSLNDIQNRIVRPIWNDPRVLYALNDGSIGGANLSKEAYLGSTINEQLNLAATEYINSLRGMQIIEGNLVLSKTFDWYKDDFGQTTEDLIHHLSHFANKSLRSELERISTVNSYTYNWHLNSTVDG